MAGKRNPGALAGAAGVGIVSQECGSDAVEAIASSLDLQVIRVEQFERRSERGDCVPVAACSIATMEGTATPICNLARKLLARGVDPATHLSVWRGEMRCFHNAPLGRWAELTVEEGSSEPVFRRYKPFPGRAVASLRRKSDG